MQFTLISAVYNVARYLPEFFASLEAQTYGIDEVEVILVDDGSTDESGALCDAFAERHPSVRVIHQQNGGQGAARNAGLRAAAGSWVSFPDPDDVLAADYLEHVAAYMARPHRIQPAVYAAHIQMWDEATGEISDSHPGAFRFSAGSVDVDLNGKPNFMHGHVNLSFFELDRLRELGSEFDSALRTRFEDAAFLAQYLVEAETPSLGLVDEAHYLYRKRSDGSSTLQGSHSDVRTYEAIAKHGYLPLITHAEARHGIVPSWLQAFIVYDLLWLMKADADRDTTRHVPAATLAALREDIVEVRAHLDLASIIGFDMAGFGYWLRETLAYGFDARPHVGDVYVASVDAVHDLVELKYSYFGAAPAERFLVGGREVRPHHATTVVRRIFGAELSHERRVWVSAAGVLRVVFDGSFARIALGSPGASEHKLRRRDVDLHIEARGERPSAFRDVDLGARRRVRAWAGRAVRGIRSWLAPAAIGDRALAFETMLPWVRRRFAGSWVLMDRDTEANDSAEVLYEWIRDHEPTQRIWFVLRRESTDWPRLKAAGFKLIPYGSHQWKLLLLLADELISTHADAYVTHPLPTPRYGPPRWRFTFLQHGIIKGDLSGWLNPKPIRTFVTSTEDEYRYIIGDGPYRFSSHEVRLTGLPRHDALLRKSTALPADQVEYLVIAPTWRKHLLGTAVGASQRRHHRDDFMETEFAREWRALVTSPELKAVAERHGLKILYLPHPNLQLYIEDFDLPAHVEVRRFGIDDIQDVVARSAMMITDHSSAAFNMAYLQRPVVYFQFDDADYWQHHIEGRGYYDYERDGFGPVVDRRDDVISAVETLVGDGAAREKYAARAAEAFPVRDGRNSERVFHAIRSAGTPIPRSTASRAAPLDSWSGADAVQPR
ncbi:CDP-glycerol glycerophosphotransferase family protein [Agromyces sp. Leaf222]|uniref:CDP-glycerol glycerophosphotransferase family protein n=1 Tax=Agromyces sp. Leaf222 TaxID=1735688 RepID=UPI0006FC8694|nr:CDP-glycerol glycerophosphotransferase family protein [Agromyces sp. Leaf222]KQM84129.1 hypothetical protein ASE68_13725 [Agromyces sp. Leaf222]